MSNYSGFPKQTIKFLQELSQNNNKEWFDEHRADYENYYLGAATDFINTIGPKLLKLREGLTIDPRVNKSIFRINRDIRFSQDKTPNKSHIGIWFWEGTRKKMKSSGFYFHLDTDYLLIGSGIHTFTKSLLKKYRDALKNKKLSAELYLALEKISKYNQYELGGKTYKRIPKGSENVEGLTDMLLFSGLTVGATYKYSDLIHSGEIINFVFKHYKQMLPLHEWLVKILNEV